jgi:hypothetical protein
LRERSIFPKISRILKRSIIAPIAFYARCAAMSAAIHASGEDLATDMRRTGNFAVQNRIYVYI